MDDINLDLSLSSFFSEVNKEKKKEKTQFKSIVGDLDLNSIFEEVGSLKKKSKKIKEKTKRKIEILENILLEDNIDLEVPKEPKEENIIENVEDKKDVLELEEPEEIKEKSLGLLSEPSNVKQQSDPLTPLDQNFVTLEDLNKHYKLFLSRIQQQISTFGGGGETNLTYMDVPITSVTTSSYTIRPQDYYIGVNYAGAVTITLPKADREGKIFVVKDELGEAAKGTNRHITILPTGSDKIDGRDRAILAFNFGSLTFIWKGNSWRVI